LVRKNGQYGFIDNTGKEVVSPVMDDLGGRGKFFDMKELFSSGGVHIQGLGQVKKFQITKFENGLAAVRNKKTWKIGMVDENMKVIVPPNYRKILVDGKGNIHVW
jgi:hypothetical protein